MTMIRLKAENDYDSLKSWTLLLDFQSAQLPRSQPAPDWLRVIKWKPPIFPHHKINFDGATFNELGAVGLGVVIHDPHGCVIGALSEPILMPLSIATVKALACRRSLIFAKELSTFESIVEGDAKVIMKVLLIKDGSHPENGHMLNDALSLAAEFRFCMFTHVKRLGNSIVHFLASRAKSGNELQVWIKFIPDNIVHLVSRDWV